jgi:hypothetical protein
LPDSSDSKSPKFRTAEHYLGFDGHVNYVRTPQLVSGLCVCREGAQSRTGGITQTSNQQVTSRTSVPRTRIQGLGADDTRLRPQERPKLAKGRAADTSTAGPSAPATIVPVLSSILGTALHDVLLTRDEYQAMAAGLADTHGPSTGSTSLANWISERGGDLGVRYANELSRHLR